MFSRGSKKYTVLRMGVLGPIDLSGKMLWHTSVIFSTCSRSHFTPCICMEEGRSVVRVLNFHFGTGVRP